MQHSIGRRLRIGAIVWASLTLLAAGLARAQSGGPYDLSWSSIDAGAGNASGDVYSLDGTIGQPDAGQLTGGNYVMGGGFWAGGAPNMVGVSLNGGGVVAPKVTLAVRPNPFTSTTEIAFVLPKSANVRLEVFDLRGAVVRVLLAETVGPGRQAVAWNGKSSQGHTVRGGVYLVRLSTPEFSASKKTVFLGNP